MKKLKLNSTLNHKQDSYDPYEVSVEKVITLYGNEFERLKNNALDYNPYITENKELICIDSDGIAHCVLFVDRKSGDGILVNSEGADYARKSQFIPNAKAIIESNRMSESERTIHKMIVEITDKIAEMAHCGNRHFCYDDILSEETLENLQTVVMQSVAERLEQREDIQTVRTTDLDIPFQSGMEVEAKPIQKLIFCCPLKIVREPEEPDYDWDEEVSEDDFEEIPCESAVGCEDEINNFIKEYSEPKEEHRGLMVYFDDNPAISEKVFSAIPSVRKLDGELMGVFECQITETLTDTELEELILSIILDTFSSYRMS